MISILLISPPRTIFRRDAIKIRTIKKREPRPIGSYLRSERRRGEEETRKKGDGTFVTYLESFYLPFRIINKKPVSSSPLLLFSSS